MKLAFSTLGVPGLPIPEVIALATAHGYQGVELRTHPEEPVHLKLTTRQRQAVADAFAGAGVTVLGIAGYARVAAPGDDGPVLEELRALLELAADLDAPFVRVFPGAGATASAADAEAAEEAAVRRLAAATGPADDRGVRLLLETHDSHRTGRAAGRIAERVGHPRVGVLWDVLHPWLAGEQPAATRAALGPHLGYVQVKDVVSAEDTTPVGLGAGALPLAACLARLGGADRDGWLCWEYEKRWYERAAPLGLLLGPGREHLLRLLADTAG
ncbi:sugar phosphate isomerase/epimerase family protein [Streptomyces sp. NPDC049906]|uniref:sugar phosphate isomerase/epimerase family protein n=1 Tax=Streptomyces sp. NPDC049906 TaxID=3155656 RepID=UPI0034322BF6